MPQLSEMALANTSIIRQQWFPAKIAAQQVVAYERRFVSGHKYLRLACHAAFPSILTPELLNLIHINFLDDENIPWVAEADFLLSPLCRQIDEHIFEVEPGIRNVLLIELENLFGSQRLLELAYFLRAFLHEKPDKSQQQYITRTHRWIAKAYIEPDKLIREITSLLEETIALDNESAHELPEQLQIHSIIELAKEPLKRANSRVEFQSLLESSNILARLTYVGEGKVRQLTQIILENEKRQKDSRIQLLPKVLSWLKKRFQNFERSGMLTEGINKGEHSNIMAQKTQTIPVRLSNGTGIGVKVSQDSFDEVGFNPDNVYNFNNINIQPVITGVANEITRSFKEIDYLPKKATIEFGVEISIESGNVNSIITKGTDNANLKVSLEWDFSDWQRFPPE